MAVSKYDSLATKNELLNHINYINHIIVMVYNIY
jgi:hypothetical protein